MKEIKEEAEMIIELFWDSLWDNTIMVVDEEINNQAKQCALIYCEGIMSISLCEDCNSAVERHWTEVKQYIQNNY